MLLKYLYVYLIVYKCGTTTSDIIFRGRRGRDRMLVGFINTYAISAYHH